MLRDDLNEPYKLYPVRKDIEGQTDCSNDVSYNKHNSLEDFFNTYKTKIYTSSFNEKYHRPCLGFTKTSPTRLATKPKSVVLFPREQQLQFCIFTT